MAIIRRKSTYIVPVLAGAIALLLVGGLRAQAQESNSDLAQELTNPLANIITLPLQLNIDRDIGADDDGEQWRTNVQPVAPFQLNDDWNLITRTILPVTWQDEVVPGTGSQFGLGDTNASFFFSPIRPTASGVTWGAGPVFVLPTATESELGGKKWGAGPSGVLLRMDGPWTYGLLANHVWSFAGNDDRPDINNTFAQPFVAYTWPSAWTVSVQTETSYNWDREEWSVPVNAAVARLVMFGKLPVSLQAGVGYWAESPANGPEGFRFRFQANLVFAR